MIDIFSDYGPNADTNNDDGSKIRNAVLSIAPRMSVCFPDLVTGKTNPTDL